TTVSPQLRATALEALALMELFLGNLDQAVGYFTESLRFYREIRDTASIMSALNGIANVIERQGDHERASKLLENGLQLCRRQGDKKALSLAAKALGSFDMMRGNYVRAK